MSLPRLLALKSASTFTRPLLIPRTRTNTTASIRNMATYIVSLKKGSPKEKLEETKKQVQEQGGTIKHEYSLLPGFSVEFPKDAVHTLEANEHLDVEADQEVRTQ